VRPAPAESALPHPVAYADNIAHHPATDHDFAAYYAATADHKPATAEHAAAICYATADHKPATAEHAAAGDNDADSHSDAQPSACWRPARTRVGAGFG
jgi:hypothetical protein